MFKVLGFLLGFALIVGMAQYGISVSNNAGYLGVCIMIAGFMAGSD